MSALRTLVKQVGDRLFWALSKREVRGLLTKYPRAVSTDIVSVTNEYQGFGWYRWLRAYQVESEFRQLVDWAVAERPETVVEIGTANGATLLVWSRIAQKRVISIDLPAGIHGGGYAEAKGKLFHQFVSDRPGVALELIRASSQEAGTRQRVEQMLGPASVDLLFIDGDHRLEGVTRDFELWKDLVRPGGHIVFHDILPHPQVPSCQVDVLWEVVKDRYPEKTREIIASPDQGWAGIGILTV